MPVKTIRNSKPVKDGKTTKKWERLEHHQNARYQNGAEGMIAWADENVCVPIYPVGEVVPRWTMLGKLSKELHPETGKSYWYIWNEQKAVIREALFMENGRFRYNLVCFCWMRGEGKSLLACLIQLWKFFCWTNQKIMLGANSKDQVKFVHYDIMRDIILNSPTLFKSIGARNIQEKEIRLKDNKGNIINIIRSISSFSGIVSNITGYTFSEMFDMKNPRFFVQLDGSIRNIPNAMGVIDSTVSEKTHVLYKMYQGYLKGKLKKTFFSYRCSRVGNLTDYWNPNMTKDQLDDYKEKFPFGEFERYFLNLWSAGHIQVFGEDMIREMGILGTGTHKMDHDAIKAKVNKIMELENSQTDMLKKGLNPAALEISVQITEEQKLLTPMDSIYTMKGPLNNPLLATKQDLKNLSNAFDTNFAIMAGLDMADPMAIRSSARSILTVFAKGLPGSKRNIQLHMQNDTVAPNYVYILLALINEPRNSVNELKKLLESLDDEYEGIDTLCSERYGTWDMIDWCLDHNIAFEPIHPTYDKQRDAFKEVFTVMTEGRLKAPSMCVQGSKSEDLFREELGIFDHDSDVRWFGSPEKKEKYGIQDDSIFSGAWAIYGGRNLTPEDFKVRGNEEYWGDFFDINKINTLTSGF